MKLLLKFKTLPIRPGLASPKVLVCGNRPESTKALKISSSKLLLKHLRQTAKSGMGGFGTWTNLLIRTRQDFFNKINCSDFFNFSGAFFKKHSISSKIAMTFFKVSFDTFLAP